MRKIRNIFIVMLSLLTFTFMMGCGSGSVADTNTEENNQTRIITDQAGNQVELPQEVNRVVISSLWPLPSVYCLYQGSADKLVGIHPAAKSAAENSLLTKVAPEITDISTDFIQNGELNVEELMKLKPDVVFGSSQAEYEMVTKAGIPYVQFVANPTGTGNTIESLSSWMKLLGEIFNENERSNEIVEYGNEVLQEIQQKVSTIKEEDKTRALMLYKYSDGTIQVSGNNFFGDFWLESGGAINVADEIPGAKEVNMEQIYAWNPEKIYITNFTSVMPEDLYNNAVEGHDWSNIDAVKNKQVYKIGSFQRSPLWERESLGYR